jgi:Protein of unknown function DUF86
VPDSSGGPGGARFDSVGGKARDQGGWNHLDRELLPRAVRLVTADLRGLLVASVSPAYYWRAPLRHGDVSQHICASEGWGPPADNGDAIRLLGEHGVLPAELAASVRRAVGFRNVLVYEYVKVDDKIVVGRLADLSDLQDFVRAVAEYVSGSSSATLIRRR